MRVRSPSIRITDVSSEEFDVALPRLLAAVKNEGGEWCVVKEMNDLTTRSWRGVMVDISEMGKDR